MTDELVCYSGTGRRKTSVAAVRLTRGSGTITANGRDLDDYLTTDRAKAAVRAPLKSTKTLNKYDIVIKTNGGGSNGQAGAMVLAIARALAKADHSLEEKLHHEGFLTRDGRMVERKKYGRRGARRGFQFSKR